MGVGVPIRSLIDCNSKSQIAARHAVFWHATTKITLASVFLRLQKNRLSGWNTPCSPEKRLWPLLGFLHCPCEQMVMPFASALRVRTQGPFTTQTIKKHLFFKSRLSDANVTESQLEASWVLPEDLCKKDPCNFNTEMFVSKVGNPCPTLGQLLASQILHALLVGENNTKSPGQDFVHRVAQSWPTLGQLLANSPPHGKLQGSAVQ